jgi:hypothetical protein
MRDRTTRKPVTFSRPFEVCGTDGKFEPGTYLVETREEMIEGLSFVAYRHVETTIEAPFNHFGLAPRHVIVIDPSDLEVAISLEVSASCHEPVTQTAPKYDCAITHEFS